jgi:ankyrin repeat protein
MTDALTPERIRAFVLSAHGNLAKVQAMLAETPALLTAAHQWGENDFEDGLSAASHAGSKPIAEFLLQQGAPLTVCAAAMLGRIHEMTAFIEADPKQANARGAHGIPILFHAAMSGSREVVDYLYTHGCTEGYSFALHAAINAKDAAMVGWLLDHGASDLTVKNWEGKSLLQKAQENNLPEVVELLRSRGAVE